MFYKHKLALLFSCMFTVYFCPPSFSILFLIIVIMYAMLGSMVELWGACMVPSYTAIQAPSVHMQYPHGIQPIPS